MSVAPANGASVCVRVRVTATSGPPAVPTSFRDGRLGVRAPVTMETERTEEEGLAFLRGSDITAMPEEYSFLIVALSHKHTHTAYFVVTCFHQNS